MKYNKLLLIVIYLSFLFLNKKNIYLFEVIYTFLFILTLFIIKELKRLSKNEIFKMILIFIIIKIIFVFKLPVLSDDIYRNLWEGKVFNHGFNPYIFSPDSDKLRFLRDNIFTSVNHKSLPAIYPPFLTIFNSIVVRINYSVIFYKLVLFIFDIFSFFLIILICNKTNKPLRFSLLYLICPLTTIEIEWSGHNDIVMIFFFLLGFYLFIKKKYIKSAFFYTISVLSKFIYLIFAKEFLKNLKSIIVFVVSGILLYSFFTNSNKNIFYSMNVYLTTWEFNGSLYKIICYFIKNHKIVRLILLTLFGFLWIFMNFKEKDTFKRMLFLIVGFIICLPTVHPWYGLWILPLLAFEFYFEIYLFLLAIPFSYYVLIDFFRFGIWHEKNFITFLIYLPLLFLLIKRIFCNNRNSHAAKI